MSLVVTILCGGAGSRLWPISRETHPKPFIRLSDGQSLLQKAFVRGANLPNIKQVLTVTNGELLFKTFDHYQEVNDEKIATEFVLEPFGRNTAPAIAAAVLQTQKTHGDDVIMLVLAADHLIADDIAFKQAVSEAAELAVSGKLVTFGIQPDAPETGYGYIEAESNKVLRFVEKPNLETATEYLQSGKFLWNSGMFCFKVSTMLEQMQIHCPEILRATRACLEQSQLSKHHSSQVTKLEPNSFSGVDAVSIDYAVMEKSSDVAVVPCKIGWSDIGSWTALGDLDAPDSGGNRIRGDVILHNAHNNTIHSQHRVLGAVGINDLIIVDTPDAILVANKASAQDVKHIYAELKLTDHDAHKLHRTVSRPWGSYTILEEETSFKIKRLVVNPGCRVSLQSHRHRNERWVVISGIALVTNNDQQHYLNQNESTYICAGHKHRLENPGADNLVLIEVQSGDYVGEDDIERYEDSYGRC
jgi:mannose-1-phosphate guanylyltransferase